MFMGKFWPQVMSGMEKKLKKKMFQTFQSVATMR